MEVSHVKRGKTVLVVFKYRLYPTKEQKKAIQFTIERCRLLYNRLLEERILAYKHEGKSLSYFDQAYTFKERKKHIPALKEVHSQALQDAAKRLDKAFQAFFRRVEHGKTPGFPRYKQEHRYDSFTYPQEGYTILGNKLHLSKIGDVKIKLHRQPQGQIKTCTITVKNGKYYACFSCEVALEKLPASAEQIGIDLGLKHLAVTSDGETFEAPKHLRQSEQKLKQLQRAVSRKQRGSNRRKKAVCLLAGLHERVANQRKDNAHKLSRQWVNRYGLIAFENLNVQGLLKNHHLSKSIADAGWNQLVQFTSYKAESAGRVLVQVDPYNTSQLCSNCGEVVKKSLAVRVHRCHHCGYVADRDENAARNILHRAKAWTASNNKQANESAVTIGYSGEEEQQQLSTIIGTRTKYDRNNARRDQERRASGKQTRTQYEVAAAKRRSQAFRMRTEGMSLRDIGKSLGVSHVHVKRMLEKESHA